MFKEIARRTKNGLASARGDLHDKLREAFLRKERVVGNDYLNQLMRPVVVHLNELKDRVNQEKSQFIDRDAYENDIWEKVIFTLDGVCKELSAFYADVSKKGAVTNIEVDDFHRTLVMYLVRGEQMSISAEGGSQEVITASVIQNLNLLDYYLSHYVSRERGLEGEKERFYILGLKSRIEELLLAFYSIKSSLDTNGGEYHDILFYSHSHGDTLKRTLYSFENIALDR